MPPLSRNDRSLRTRTIRLAAARPDLRPYLLPMLRHADQNTPQTPMTVPGMVQPVMQPVMMVPMMPVMMPMQPVILQQPVVAPAPPPPLADSSGEEVFVQERTLHGFTVDFAPELDRMLQQKNSTRKEVGDWGKVRLRDAFRAKDKLYQFLLRHQSVNESDQDFARVLERCIDLWVVGR